MLRKSFILSLCAAIGVLFAIGSSFVFSPHVNAQTPRVPSTSGRQANVVDVAFVNEAAQAGLANITLGQLALQRSQNPQVRSFAQAEIQEQQNNKQALTRIAPQVGVQLPTTPGPKFQAILARMQQLSGTQFDNAYLDEGGVNAHLENAALFQREAAFGRNPDLIALVNQGLPIINQHFTTASRLTNYRFAQVARRYTEGQTTSTSIEPQTQANTSSPATGATSTTDTTSPTESPIVPQRY